jgi:hypothetical protein
MSATFLNKNLTVRILQKRLLHHGNTGGFSRPQSPPDQAGRVDNGSQLDQLDEDFDEAMLGFRYAEPFCHGKPWPGFSASKVDSTDFKTIPMTDPWCWYIC